MKRRMAHYGTNVPEFGAEDDILSQTNNAAPKRRWLLPLFNHGVTVLTAGLKTESSAIETGRLVLPAPVQSNQLFTGLQNFKATTADPSPNGAVGTRMQRFSDRNLQTYDCFTLSRQIDSFIADWNAGKAAFNGIPMAGPVPPDMDDIYFTIDAGKLQLVFVFTGDLAAEWGRSNVGTINSFFSRPANRLRGKSLREHIRAMYNTALAYIPVLYDNYNWDPVVSLVNPEHRDALYRVGNLGRAVLQPTKAAFRTFLRRYRTVVQGVSPESVKENLLELLKQVRKSTSVELGQAALGDRFAVILGQLREQILEAGDAAQLPTSTVIGKAALEAEFARNPSALDGLIGGVANVVRETFEQSNGDFRRDADFSVIGVEKLNTIAGGPRTTTFYKLRESVDYLQAEINKTNPSFGDVLKSVVVPEAQWQFFRRDVRPAESGISFTVDAPTAPPDRLTISVKRPRNYLSWQHIDQGDRFLVTSGDELIFGVKGGGAVATNAARDFTVDGRTDGRKHGTREFEIHFGNDDNFTEEETFKASIDLGSALPNVAFLVTDFAADADMKATASVRIAAEYFEPQFVGLLQQIDAVVHVRGTEPGDGIKLSFAQNDAAQQDKQITLPDDKEYVFSARYVSKAHTSPWATTGAITGVPSVVPPLQALAPRGSRVDDAIADTSLEATQASALAKQDEIDAPSAALDDAQTQLATLEIYIKGQQKAMDHLQSEPNNHVKKNVKWSLTPLAQNKFDLLRADLDDSVARLAPLTAVVNAHISKIQNKVTEREGDLQAAQHIESRDVLKQIRDAVEKDPVTIGDFQNLMNRRSYNLPLVPGEKAFEEWQKVPAGDQTYAIANRAKLQVFVEKGSLDKSQVVSGPEFITVLQAAISSHMPSVMKARESAYRAPRRSVFKTKTKGIGHPFLKNKPKFRFRLA